MNEPPLEVFEALRRFLDEDIRSGDVTVASLGDMGVPGVGVVFAKSRALLAGMQELVALAKIAGLSHEVLIYEGNWVSPGDPVLRLTGPVSTLLGIERVALNIVMRMSGIATKTHNLLEKARAANPNIRVAATRKTTPGFRYFEKRAVTIGGGDPHRYALDDMVLIKNNHIAVAGGVADAVHTVREAVSFSKKVSCEVRSLDDAVAAVQAGADIVLLDNFSVKGLQGVVRALNERGLRDKAILEVSGGVNESNVAEYAATGIDVISAGALTHSYQSSDFNMLISLM